MTFGQHCQYTHKMNKTILSIAVGVVFFLAVSHSNANVCTISQNNLNGYRKTSKDLVTTSNKTEPCKFNPLNSYYVRDTYRTRHLTIRSENRRIRVNGKDLERSYWFRVDDSRRIRLTRSESLPDIRRERVRNAREREVDFRGIERKPLEHNDRRLVENRFDERTFRREIRDTRYERQITRDNIIEPRRTAYIRQNNMAVINNKNDSNTWPFSNFVQSAIGVLGLYYFGMHNKRAK